MKEEKNAAGYEKPCMQVIEIDFEVQVLDSTETGGNGQDWGKVTSLGLLD